MNNTLVRLGRIVMEPLASRTPPPASFHDCLARAALRLADARQVIVDPEYATIGHRATTLVLPAMPPHVRSVVDAAVARTAADGLATGLPILLDAFVTMAVDGIMNAGQAQRVRTAIARGGRFCFMLTDSGGARLDQWRTRFERSSGRLVVDKRWIIAQPNAANFGIVAARLDGNPIPSLHLLNPEATAGLAFQRSGRPFLGGTLHLWNIRGTLNVAADDITAGSDPGALASLLGMARPHFVRCVLRHLLWLRERGAVEMDGSVNEGFTWLREVVEDYVRDDTPGPDRIHRVPAMKFATNEFLLELVAAGAFRDASDERDALALTKMEGSSYQCFRELCAAAEVRHR